MDEAALHRIVGQPAIMKDQLLHLINMSSQSNIFIHVIPYNHSIYPAIENSFTILEFPGPMKGVVCVEGIFGMLYLERERDIKRYADTFRETQSIAMSDFNSIKLIAKLRGELAE
jgi:hypothetical protein